MIFRVVLFVALFAFSACKTGIFHGNTKSDTSKHGTPGESAPSTEKWKDGARVLIEQRGEEVRICGDKFPEAYKNASNNIVRIEFTVVGEGVVQKIRSIQNTTGSKGIQTCLIEAFKTTKFNPIPKNQTSVIFSFSFEFKGGGAPGAQ